MSARLPLGILEGFQQGASAEQEEGRGKHCGVGGHFPAKASVGGACPALWNLKRGPWTWAC